MLKMISGAALALTLAFVNTASAQTAVDTDRDGVAAGRTPTVVISRHAQDGTVTVYRTAATQAPRSQSEAQALVEQSVNDANAIGNVEVVGEGDQASTRAAWFFYPAYNYVYFRPAACWYQPLWVVSWPLYTYNVWARWYW